ncbi:single-stranded-DNA-specific exonuclease RecJ [Gracilibacillus caseinilyticus]|uniref:Single-stranded-DNA-specific exonuclease RecJ n=1 Tax=Gracilibacillus caseinilyticus TaxID=2932256 RepID=A0ABY4ETM7_9BACI|nr:single-stranded-DNA-specific exonuclease RecJ [Gracilibacillus caseinilyticus]UOQ47330.1 single-stranded-DNA-specific exonuclease RecJ [Gracilibacillus caseinilyticus]
MLESQSNWIFTYKNTDQESYGVLADVNVSPVIKQLLWHQGIDTEEKVDRFLLPSLDQLHSPEQFYQIDKAIQRVKQAIEAGESILVYGDYDADGVTSTTVMVEALRESGAMCDYYIPNRFTEGYGPNEEAFREAHSQGFQLIITVDNGIAGVEEVAVANQLGMDVIITDHHEMQETLPEAHAIIHPKCSEDYPFKELAGVGVAFKFAQQLLGYFPEQFLDLVVVGTIADLVPLHDENRVLVYHGLKALSRSERKGMKALKKLCQIEGNVTEEDIGFRIGPRLNAVGRLQDANLAVDLLLTDDPEEAEELANYVQDLNTERQKIVADITKEAISQYEEADHTSQVIIVAKEGWNQGVLGIVASKLVQTYYRPAIVLAIDSETKQAKGSARSIDGFDMFQNCMQHRELFTHFGGHAQAAGMTLPVDNVETLETELDTLANQQLTEDDFKPQLSISGSLAISDINMELLETIDQLAPFGMGNPKPLFHLEATPSDIKQIGATKNHLKLRFSESGQQLDTIGFGLGEKVPYLAKQTPVEVVGELQINEWNGIRKPQMLIKDMAVTSWQLFDYRGMKNWQQQVNVEQPNQYFVSFQGSDIQGVPVCDKDTVLAVSHPVEALYLLDVPTDLEDLQVLIDQVKFERLIVCFSTNDSQYFRSLPNRDEFKWLYQLILKRKYFDYKVDAPKLASFKGWKLDKIKFMFQVFHELNFVTRKDGVIVPTDDPSKKDLTEATVYQERKQEMELEEIFIYSSYSQLKTWFSEQMKKRSNEEEIVYGL